MHLMPCSNGLKYTFNSNDFAKKKLEICGFSDEEMNSVYFMAYLVQGIYILISSLEISKLSSGFVHQLSSV